MRPNSSEAYRLEIASTPGSRTKIAKKIRQRVAQAYDKYQHCGLRAARRLFASCC
jgi:hypothetical protein